MLARREVTHVGGRGQKCSSIFLLGEGRLGKILQLLAQQRCAGESVFGAFLFGDCLRGGGPVPEALTLLPELDPRGDGNFGMPAPGQDFRTKPKK